MTAGGRQPKALRILGWIAVAAAALIFLQETAGLPKRRTVSIKPQDVVAGEGSAYAVSLVRLKVTPPEIHAKAALVEDGTVLPNRVKVTQDVRTSGRGAYSFSAKQLWFSSTDNSDPRTNGKVYQVILPTIPSWPWTALAWLCLLGGLSTVAGVKPWFFWRSVRRTTDSPPPAPPREWGLDVIRALAVLLVLGRHGKTCPDEVSSLLAAFTSVWQNGGWVGVDIFFVLSGYLVSGLLWNEWQRHHHIDVARFLLRRAFKIYPAFWVMILATFVVASFTGIPSFDVNGVIGELTFMQDYVGGMWVHTWSLAVEEHFYILLALVFALATAGRHGHGQTFRFMGRLTLWVCIGCLLIRCLRQLYMGDLSAPHYFLTHARLDSLMFGVFLRWIRFAKPSLFSKLGERPVLLTVSAGLMLAPAFVLPFGRGWWINGYGLSFHYVAAACLLLAMNRWEAKQQWRRLTKPLWRMGKHSYSIYLWHLPVHAWLALPISKAVGWETHPTGAWLLYEAVYLGGSLAFGSFMSSLIEQPVLHWRDRWLPSAAAKTA